MPKGVYVRIGTSTRRANHDYIEDLIREGQRLTFDEEAVQQSKEILSQDLLKDFYGKQLTTKRLFADKILVPSPANSEIYLPTIAGTLFFSEHPEQFIPEATILCTQFKGNTGREIILTREIKGPLAQLAEEAYRLSSAWLTKGYSLQNTRLKGILSLPREALREAIINALIHRKYSVPGAVKIAIYDDRCEIFNPGCFPGLMDTNHLGDGMTYLRNPVVARIARQMGLVEKLGSGIRLIFESCEKAGLKRPSYVEGADSVKITFYLKPQRKQGESDEEAILSLLKMQGELTTKEITDYLGVSRNTSSRKLSSLLKRGKITRRGKGPSVRYYLSLSSSGKRRPHIS